MANNLPRQFKHPVLHDKETERVSSFDDVKRAWTAGSPTEEILWNGKTVTVAKLLSFREVSQFINAVMDLCFDTEHEIAVPEAADFAIRLNVLMRYAGIMMTGDIEEQYQIVYESGLYEAIANVVNQAQLDAIRQTVQTCVLHMM